MSELGTRLFQLKLKYCSCLFSPMASMKSAIFMALKPFQLRSSSIKYLEFWMKGVSYLRMPSVMPRLTRPSRFR